MPGHTENTAPSKTWILFESGSGVEVDLSLYSPPRDRARPIDAYVVTECEGNFTGSARRAAETVYNILHQDGFEMEPVVVGYDLQGLTGSRPVTGESGGLALAIALAKRVLDQDPGPVAATGEITSGHGGGPVGPVRGIQAKLQAVGRLAPENGWVFYPQGNDREIPDELRRSLTEKGLKLRPVSSVAEALGHLFTFPGLAQQQASSARRIRKRFMPGLLVLLLAAAVALLLARIHGWPPFVREPPQVASEMRRNSVPAAVINPKEAIDDSGGITVSVPPPAQDSQGLLLDIRLSGETWMAKKLAQMTRKELKRLLKKDITEDSGVVQISGHVVVSNRTENYSDITGQTKTQMTVAIKGLTVKSGNTVRPPREYRLEMKGNKTARALLPQAAAALAREILKSPPVQKKEGSREERTSHGFD